MEEVLYKEQSTNKQQVASCTDVEEQDKLSEGSTIMYGHTNNYYVPKMSLEKHTG